MKKLALYLVVAAVAAACASKEAKQEPTGVTDRSTGLGNQPTLSNNTTTNPTNPNPGITRNPLTDPQSPLYKRSVYFDYDSNVVKDEYRGMVQAHSRYLTDKRDAHIRIEGNCDERGSREYNLALGQRRAESVKKIMTVLGVPDARVETVSYGEEKPVAPGHDEAAWAQNRRADIKYAGE
jgi:peptidoglycan-associated lipoprotein